MGKHYRFRGAHIILVILLVMKLLTKVLIIARYVIFVWGTVYVMTKFGSCTSDSFIHVLHILYQFLWILIMAVEFNRYKWFMKIRNVSPGRHCRLFRYLVKSYYVQYNLMSRFLLFNYSANISNNDYTCFSSVYSKSYKSAVEKSRRMLLSIINRNELCEIKKTMYG